MHIKMMIVFYPTFLPYYWVKNGHERYLPPHGQNTLEEILDTTEVIKIAGF